MNIYRRYIFSISDEIGNFSLRTLTFGIYDILKDTTLESRGLNSTVLLEYCKGLTYEKKGM